MAANCWLVLGVVALGASQVAACSSHFESCSDTRTCPDGSADNAAQGDAGAGGDGASAAGHAAASADAPAAGAAGEPSATACVHDSDCSDHLACNGNETCEAGQCVPGVSPCANPDVAHCATACTELNGAASCTVHGQDADKDGHFSSACKENPGDDCDDSLPTVYAGAPELCDGVDNDCNQMIDLEDGVQPGGTTVPVAPIGVSASSPAIAWAPDRSVFGMAYRDVLTNTHSDVYFETVDSTGKLISAPQSVNTGLPLSNGLLSLAWGAESFAVVWATSEQKPYYEEDVELRTVKSNGNFLPGTLLIEGAPGDVLGLGVAGTSDGAFGVFFTDDPQSDYPDPAFVILRGLSATGTQTANSDSFAAVQSFGLASNGAGFAAVTSDLPTSSVAPVNTVEFWDSAFKSNTLASVAGRHPVVGSSSTGVGIALQGVTDNDPPMFDSFTTAGVQHCSAVPFADRAFIPAGVVATPNGYLVVSGKSGALRAQEIRANCSLGPLFTIDAGPVSDVSIAGSTAGYGIVWDDPSGKSAAKRRLIGPRFCD